MTTHPMSFLDHLVELRGRLIKALVAVGVGTAIAFFGNRAILDILSRPYLQATDGEALNFFEVTEAFSLVMRVSLFGGLIVASPVVIYQIWRFIGPALTPRERRYVVPLSAVMAVLFSIGITLGYLVLPVTLDLLLGFGQEILQPTIGADFYLRFAMRFLFTFGVAFLFPVFLFAGAAMGLMSTQRLRSGRRWAVTIIIIGSALVTPGDPLTTLILSAPLYILYEATILLIRLIVER